MINFATFKNPNGNKSVQNSPLLYKLVGMLYTQVCYPCLAGNRLDVVSFGPLNNGRAHRYLCLLFNRLKTKRMKKENLNAVVPGSQVAAEWSLIKDGNFVTFEVKGDSMDDGTADSYKDGEILICKTVEGDIQVNRDYVIVRGHDAMVRRVVAHHSGGNTIAVHSLNPLYKDETVSLSDVEVYNVVISQRQRQR